MEIWIPLARAPELYEVSNMGNFRAKPKVDAKGAHRQMRPLIPSVHKDGYLRINLFINGKASHVLAHRLIYETFHGPIPPNHEINHLNGVRSDNRPENLNALTHADNVRYSKDHLGADYATYGNSRMTPEQRELIFEMRNNGSTFQAIADHIGFSKRQVLNVWHGRSWKI